MIKKLIAILLVVVLVISLLPVSALAAEAADVNADAENPFTDVNENNWFYKNVMYAFQKGLFAGINDSEFNPHGTMTRAMYVTVLGRIAKLDIDDYKNKQGFSDVDPNSWYGPYVCWAKEMQIVDGMGDKEFNPNGLITREQMAVMTVRFFDVYKIPYPETSKDTLPADFDMISTWAQSAVKRLWSCGLLEGDNKGRFNPKNKATRAEAAAFCGRTDEIVEKWYAETKKDKENTTSPIYYQTFYTLSFDSNGGSNTQSFSRYAGGNLSNLPIPYKENYIFQGWYYDEALTQLVSSNDVLRSDLKLYAKWGDAALLKEAETPHFASATDQTKDFTINILGIDSMTAEEVRRSISVKNLNSQAEKEWIRVSKNSSLFTVTGINYLGENGSVQDGFEEGSAYKLTLLDNRLKFEGFPQEARDYNFTIKKADVYNLNLNEKMEFIRFADISNITEDGHKTDTINAALFTVSENGGSVADMVKGTFTFTGGTLQVGDTVTIYEGIKPSERKLDDTREGADGAVAYVEITSKNGDVYGYKTAEVEEVLFTPDILPVASDADTDGSTTNNSITVPMSIMDFSDDMYAAIGLDSQTTLDKGDYISFYEGELTANPDSKNAPSQGGDCYAVITSVVEDGENYIIAYESVSLETLLAAMDMYNTDSLDGDRMLEDVDVAALEEKIKQQAVDSGFAEEAGQYLAAMAIETKAFTEITEDFELRNYEILTQSGEPVSEDTIQLMESKKLTTKVEVQTPKVQITKKLEHFDTTGLRVALKIEAKITIAPSMPEDGDAQIIIKLTGEIEEEVHIAINVDGGARWEWWAIFPYIAEYEVTANVDLFNYTGLKFNASIVTKEYEDTKWTDNEDLTNVVDELKELVDEVKEGLGSGEEEDDPANDLIKKYKAMIDTESDWVTLVEKEIWSYGYRIPPIMIIEIKIEIKFVLQANMNISIGAEFWYKTAKRYSYNVEIFAKNVSSDVIDFVEEQYEFTFYVMGTLGLRVGISLEAKICLFTEKFASVGFSAEAGAYIRMWGYFYYKLTYKASQGKSSYYAGALYFELGIYLEISFEAQAFAGTFSYNPTLYENEWPLWSAGMRENIQDFAYQPEEVPELSLKKAIKVTMVPDSVFEMLYLDLKTGDDETKIYSDSENYFTISMTNNKFAYDRATNKLTVNPADTDISIDGQMIITWVNQPLAWTSKPISRTINLHWDNLNDGYAIVFHTNGGSSVPIIIGKYSSTVPVPANPEKKGYVFGGWHSDAELSKPYSIPAVMPNYDIEVYAKWTPATNTPYKVEHYGEVLGSSQYVLLDSVVLTGTTDSIVPAATKSYVGYITPQSRQITILPDGTSILRYYYDRQSYTLTFLPGEAQGEAVVSTLKYGATIVAPQLSSKGYAFEGWNYSLAEYMPAQNLTYTAKWKPASDTPYRVEYYVQQISGKYTLQRLDDTKKGITGSTVNILTLLDNSYLVENGISYKDTTVNGEATTAPVITKDGKLIIKVNYQRISHNVVFNPDNGNDSTMVSTKYQELIKSPSVEPTKQGYVFDGWNGYTQGDKMGTADVTYTARWKPSTNTAYIVRHIRQDLNESYPTSGSLLETEIKNGTTGEQTAASAKSYAGFTAGEVKQTSILPDGTAVVEIRYSRNSYTVKWMSEGQEHKTELVKYGITITAPTNNPTKQGYVFDGWEGYTQGDKMVTADASYTARWKPATDTPYTVKHIREDLNGIYSIQADTIERGTTGSQTRASAKTYEGFTAGAVTQSEIMADGSTVVEIRYSRNSYDITWTANGEVFKKSEDVKYGTVIALPNGTPSNKTGYTFKAWSNVPATMPAGDISCDASWTANMYTVSFNVNGGALTENDKTKKVTYDSPYGKLPIPTYAGYSFVNWTDDLGNVVTEYTEVEKTSDHELKAVWTANKDTVYTVRHYQQNIKTEGYTQYGSEVKLQGTTGTETLAAANTYEGFTVREFSQKTIAGDGTTVVEIYYDRNSYTVNWMSEGELHMSELVKYGDSIIPPSGNNKPTKQGYVLDGWSGLGEGAVMGTTKQEFTAIWSTATNTPYTVNHLREALNGEYTILEKVTEHGTTEAQSSAVPKTYEGFAVGTVTQTKIIADGSAVVEIRYSRNSYALTWIANGEVYGTPENVKYGAEITLPAGKPDNKTGYTFKEWSSVPENMPAKDSSYEAVWTANQYTVTFDGNGGTTPNTQLTVTYGSEYGELPSPIYEGYRFVGWLDANNDTVTEKTIVNTAAHHTLTAFWAAKSDTAYTVRHYQQNVASDGYTQYDVETKYGVTGVETAAKPKNYDGFTAQSVDQGMIAGDGSTVVDIYYNRNKHTVTWNSDNESRTEEYRYGAYIITADTVKIGYDFAGWSPSVVNTMPDYDLNYTATWKAKQFTVNFDGNGGTTPNAPLSVTYDGKYTGLPTTTRTGYNFAGWYTEAVGGEEVTAGTNVKITSNQTLYAHWTAKNYSVSFDLNNGTGETPAAIDVTYGSSYTNLPECSGSKLGYTFDGWFTAENGGTEITSVSTVNTAWDHALYAHWKANEYTLSFNVNGGKAVNPITVIYDSNYGTLPVPTYAGYRFVNWTDEQGSEVIASTIVKTASAHELKAVWAAKTDTAYTVRHYQQNIKTEGYTQYGSDVKLQGTTGTETLAAANTYEGFTALAFSQKTIAGDGTVVVEIYYNRNSYTVKWMSEGQEYKTEQVKYGYTITAPATNPSRQGYDFGGWNGLVTGTVMGVTEQVFTASWAPSTNTAYTVNHLREDLDGEYTIIETDTKTGTTEEQSSAVPKTYEGFTAGAVTQTEILADGSTVVEIRYSRNSYALTWIANGEVYGTPANVKYGAEITLPVTTPDNKTGYTFKEWSSVPSTMPAKNSSYAAAWTANNYTIVFNGNGADGGQVLNQSCTYDQTQSLSPNKYSRTGHTFTGWNSQADGKGTSYANTANVSNLAAEGSVSLFAQWSVNQYTISFNSNGGTDVATLTQNYGTTVTAPTPTRAGYIFEAWQKDGANYTFGTMPAESFTLTAKWKTVDYDISYALNGGINNTNNPASYNIESGSIILAEASGKTGYTFVGWYTDAEYKNQAATIAIEQGSTGAKTFYAKWTPNTYTVTFHKNTGDGITANQSFTYDEAARALTANGFVRNGYSFIGWNTKADGSGTSYTDKQAVQNLAVSGNLNLYAKWQTVNYSIKYELNGGTQAAGQTESYTVESNDITLKAPTRGNGYGFMGWYDNAGFTGSAVSTITKGSTGNKTLYAKWGFAGTFTVTNNNNNTFTITRSGNGTSDTQNVGQQTVYFRTVNGSAIGGTHFYHLGGSSAAVTFLDGETSKTVTVTEYGVVKAYTSAAAITYNATKYSNIDRSYQLELVRVDGGGLLGATTKATRTMAKDSGYTVSSNIYSSYQSFASQSVSTEIFESVESWKGSRYTGLAGNPFTGRSDLSANTKQYLQDTASAMRVKLDITGEDDGWGMCRFVFFNNHTNGTSSGKGSETGIGTVPSGTKAAFSYGTTSDNRDAYTVSLPAATGAISATGTSKSVSVYNTWYSSGQSGTYLLYGFSETCGISVGAYCSGIQDSSWYYKGGALSSAVHDTKEPSQIGIAPMAVGSYKAGEMVTVAVVFDEIVSNANGAAITGTNLTGSWACSGGTNSNVLYFTGTVKADCNENTILSGISLSGTPKDMAN